MDPLKPIRWKWPTVSAIALLHAGALLAPFTFTWSAFAVFMEIGRAHV